MALCMYSVNIFSMNRRRHSILMFRLTFNLHLTNRSPNDVQTLKLDNNATRERSSHRPPNNLRPGSQLLVLKLVAHSDGASVLFVFSFLAAIFFVYSDMRCREYSSSCNTYRLPLGATSMSNERVCVVPISQRVTVLVDAVPTSCKPSELQRRA